MLEKTRGILLHTVKYGDNSLIHTMYTEKFGRQAYILNAARGARSKNKSAHLQPLYIVDMEVYQKKNREVQRIKELKLISPYHSIPFDVVKTSQAIFLAELLNKIILEEEQNPGLYSFLESSFLFFDLMETGKTDFHIWFLTHLTTYLGIMPGTWDKRDGWLDMHRGTMVAEEPPHPAYMTPETSTIFRQLSGLRIQDLSTFRIKNTARIDLINKILEDRKSVV